MVERSAPGANITTAADALWYLLVTMSTVGSGDYYPVTDPGRVIGSMIIVVGVGVCGTLAGFLANAFLSSSEILWRQPLRVTWSPLESSRSDELARVKIDTLSRTGARVRLSCARRAAPHSLRLATSGGGAT